MKTLFSVLSIVATLWIAGQSFGGLIGVSQDPNNCGACLNNTVTNDIFINAPPGVSIGAMQILLQLTSGFVYENAFQSPGGGPPNAAFIPTFPELVYDSFVAAGSKTSDQQPIVLGPSLELGGPAGPSAVFNATTYDASYGPPLGQVNAGAQHYEAARLTLSKTANGSFKFKVDFDNNTSAGNGFGNFGSLPVVNGVIIPEPATATLLGLVIAGVAGFIRRRSLNY